MFAARRTLRHLEVSKIPIRVAARKTPDGEEKQNMTSARVNFFGNMFAQIHFSPNINFDMKRNRNEKKTKSEKGPPAMSMTPAMARSAIVFFDAVTFELGSNTKRAVLVV